MGLILLLAFLIKGAWAEEHEVHDMGLETVEEEQERKIQDMGLEVFEEGEEVYEYPDIRPEMSVLAGYRFVGLAGSSRAGEYEYLHNSFTLGEELRAFSFPHRLHLDIDLKSKKDFLGEASYAYRDIIYFRGINRTLFHNLDNITLRDLDPATHSPGVDITDAGKKYGVKTGINNFFLRFKTPNFPSHLYIDVFLLERKGTEQQLSLAGSGYRNDNIRKSQERGIDWQTKNIAVGVNSHLGPVEVDISHSEKRFDSGGDRVLYEDYTAANSVPARLSGRYPHNLAPELTGSTDTIRLHTSYTGGLVAAATISRTDRENKDSGAKADYFTGAGELIWMPLTKLSFFLRYRHKEIDADNPDLVSLRDITNPLNSYTYSVRPSLSSRTDTTSVSARYRLTSFLTLRPEYIYENTDRVNAGLWTVPDSTQRQILSLSADSRLMKTLSLKTGYTHREIHDPAYNAEPNRSDEGRIALSFVPVQRINMLLSYNAAYEKRDDLRFTDQAGNIAVSPGARDALRDKAFGSVTFLLRDNLSLTTSFADMQSKTRQDISFRTSASPGNIDPRVPYKEYSHNYAVDVAFAPKSNLNINTEISRTVASAKFFPSSRDLVEPVSIASFSDLKSRETLYSLSGEYGFRGGLKLAATYRYCTVKDVIANPFDDLENGTVHILMVTLTKGF